MRMKNMVIISIDGHICEPPTLLDNQLSGELLASAFRFKTQPDGTDYWEYQGNLRPSVGLKAVVGRPLEEYGMEPTSIEQLCKGCYDVHTHSDDKFA